MNHFLEQSWIQALGWTLLHATWQASLVAITWLIAKRFLKNASAHLRYLAAISALIALIACSAVTFWKVYPNQIEISSSLITVESLSLSSFDVSVAPNSVRIQEGKNINWNELLNDIAPWLSLLWILGAAIMGLRFASGIFYLDKLRNKGLQEVDTFWQARSAFIAQKMGLYSNWQIKESSLVSEPLTLGHFKPLILIPMGMLSGLSPEQVEAIIAHEFAHIYRSDFLFNLIQSLIEILFFFHPAIWWLSKEIRRERELCCDDLAIATLGDAFVYAEALTRLQVFCHSPKHFLTMQAKGNSGSFTSRVQRLFIPQRPNPSAWKSVSAAVLISIGIMGSGFYAYTQTLEEEVRPSTSEDRTQRIQQESDIISFEKNYEDWKKSKYENKGKLVSNSIKYISANGKTLAKIRLSPENTDEELKSIQRQLLRLTDKKTGFKRYRNAQRELLEFFYFNHNQGVFYKSGLRDFEEIKLFVVEKENGEISLGFKSDTGTTLLFDNELKIESFQLKSSDSEEKLHNWISKQNKQGAGIELISLKHNATTKALASFSLKQTSKIRLRQEGTTLLTCQLPCTLTAIYDERGEVSLTSSSATALNLEESQFPTYLNNKFLGYFEGQVPEIFDQLIEKGIIESAEDLGNANLVALRKTNFHSFFEREELPVQASMDTENINFNKFRVLILNTWEDLAEKYSIEGEEKHRFYGLNGKWVGIRVGTVKEQVKQICEVKGIDPDQIEVQRLSPEQAKRIYHVRAVEAIDIQVVKQEKPISFIYLNEKPMGYFEGGSSASNLIKIGAIHSFEDIASNGTSSTFVIEKGDFKDFISAQKGELPESKYLKNLKIPEPFKTDGKYPEVFAIQVMQTWEHLAGKLEQEVEEKPTEPKPETKQIKINGKITYPTQDGSETVEVKGDAFLFGKDRNDVFGKPHTDEHFYLLDGKPLGFRKGEIYYIITQELSARNIKKIGGIVMYDASIPEKENARVVQILSEEYAKTYYKRIELQEPILEKIQRTSTNSEIWLDGKRISIETLKQIDPSEIATVDILKGESAKAFSNREDSKDIIHIRTNTSEINPKAAGNLDLPKNLNPQSRVDLKMDVSPNPSTDTFNIKFKLEHKAKVHFTVRDILGKVIYKSSPKVFEAGTQKIKWKPNKVANGYYHLKLETANGNVSTKMIILKR